MRALVLCLALFLGLPGAAHAHESRPIQLELNERAAGLFELSWRLPGTITAGDRPDFALSDICSPVGGVRQLDRAGLEATQLYQCAQDPAASALQIIWPRYNPSVSTLLRVNWANSETHSQLHGPSDTTLILPDRETRSGVASQYFWLGVTHILKGYDHLLFLGCLVFIAGTGRRIFVTITGFTLAHSITLILAALGWIRLPIAPVEAVIALSIVFLAAEIARPARDTLTWRYPIAVSSSFGLLHGLGFAAVLGEIGLPQTERLTALLVFNLGVEAGQLIFVFAVIAGLFLLQRLGGDAQIMNRAARPAAYLIGTISAFWLIERIAGFA